jgi:VanZ family protein
VLIPVARPSAQFVARRTAIAVFWTAVAFTFACAVMPVPDRLHLADRDKIEHFVAFFTLTVLATAAYPRRAVAVSAMKLLAFGAFIEVVQALPLVGREGDLADLLVDAAAIGSAGLLMVFTGARFKLLRLLRPTPDFVQSVHGR